MAILLSTPRKRGPRMAFSGGPSGIERRGQGNNYQERVTLIRKSCLPRSSLSLRTSNSFPREDELRPWSLSDRAPSPPRLAPTICHECAISTVPSSIPRATYNNRHARSSPRISWKKRIDAVWVRVDAFEFWSRAERIFEAAEHTLNFHEGPDEASK